MKSEIYTCDVCGTQKRESNHWFNAVIVGEEISFHPWNVDTDFKDLHLCSKECAHKKLEDFLSQ